MCCARCLLWSWASSMVYTWVRSCLLCLLGNRHAGVCELLCSLLCRMLRRHVNWQLDGLGLGTQQAAEALPRLACPQAWEGACCEALHRLLQPGLRRAGCVGWQAWC